MPVKSIIDIDVHDEAFKRFAKLFDDYQERLKEMPGDWKKVDEAINGANRKFRRTSSDTQAMLAGMAAATGTIAEAIHKSTQAQRQFESATRRSHSAMHGLAKTSEKVAHTIFGIGKWMLKFGALGGGLAGVAGGFALDDLANSAMSRQRAARGIGMTPGQSAAFSTYFNQFGNAEGLASNVATARNDVTKRWVFGAMGIGGSALRNDSNFELSIAAERRAQQMVKSYPRADWLNIAQATGLTQLFSPETLRVLRHTSAARLNAAAAGAEGSTNALGFSNATARDWAGLSVQMRKNWVEIESSLITGLHRLAPEITTVSGDVSRWISAFATGGGFQRVVGEVAHGIQGFATYVGSPRFHASLHTFATDIELVASKTVAALRWLDLIPSPGVSFGQVSKASSTLHQPTTWADRAAAFGQTHGLGYSSAEARRAMSVAEAAYHLPSGMLWRLSGAESSHGANLLGPQTRYGRAEGWFQLLPSTAKSLGVSPWTMRGKHGSAMGAAHYLSILHSHYGNWDEAIAAYNWGPANVDADIKAHGARWLAYAPAQTQREVAAVSGAGLPASVNRLVAALRKQNAHKSPTVWIRNQSSARVAVQAQGAAY